MLNFFTSFACDACDKYHVCSLPTPECRKYTKRSGNADDGSFAKLLGLSVLDIPNLGAQSTSCHLKSWKFLSKRLRGWANHLGTSEVPLSGLEPPFRSYNRGKVICEREKMEEVVLRLFSSAQYPQCPKFEPHISQNEIHLRLWTSESKRQGWTLSSEQFKMGKYELPARHWYYPQVQCHPQVLLRSPFLSCTMYSEIHIFYSD